MCSSENKIKYDVSVLMTSQRCDVIIPSKWTWSKSRRAHLLLGSSKIHLIVIKWKFNTAPYPKSHDLNKKYQPLAKPDFNVFGIQPITTFLVLSALTVLDGQQNNVGKKSRIEGISWRTWRADVPLWELKNGAHTIRKPIRNRHGVILMGLLNPWPKITVI